jgi:superfamily I DNA/RNA helicase
MVDIEEIERDSSCDYTKILRALLELPFSVGKGLLADFLNGNYKNKSVSKNNLDELHNFGSLLWEKDKIYQEVEKLIRAKMIEQVSADYNNFVKVLRITLKGRNEVVIPTLYKKKEIPKVSHEETKISSEDKEVFKEFSGFLDGYNDEQKKAIVAGGKSVLTIAGAGSGKTTVLVKRIEFLVKYRSVHPSEILAITFTRKARQEMEKRLESLGVGGVNVQTFNSFCEKILRKHGKEVYGRQVRVLGYPDKILAMNLAMFNLDMEMLDVTDLYFSKSMKKMKTPTQLQNIFMNDCFSVIDYFKTIGQELYDLSRDVDLKDKKMAKMVYDIVKYLSEHKRVQGLRGFVDQLVDVVAFFKKCPSTIPYYEHVLVDEYQDVNSLQVEILNLLNFDNIFAVGDPRQSVYGWRGSDVKFIMNYEEDFGDTETVHLVKNYRSDKKVVDFMNMAIREMDLPDLEHHHELDSDIKLFSFDSEEAERSFVFQVVSGIIKGGGEAFVLARTNRQLFEFSQILKAKGINHVMKTDDSNGGKPSEDIEGYNLVLATVHAIKGLESDNVFVMGCNKDSFPCRASDHPVVEMIKDDDYDKFEEEKRLFYVAVSRAKKNLYMTHSGTVTDFITLEMEEMLEGNE